MVYSVPCVALADEIADGSSYTLTFSGLYSDGTAETSSMWVTDVGYYSFYANFDNRFLLTQPFDFVAGYWYSGSLSLWVNTGLSNSPVDFTMRLSLGDDQATFTRNVTTQATSYGTAVVTFDFDFYVDRAFSCSGVQVELSDLNIETNFTSQIESSFSVSVESDAQHQTSAIGGFFDGLWKKLSGAFDKIGNWFSALGDRIQGFFTQLIEDIKGLFVPSDGFFEEQQQLIQDTMTDRLGMVAQAGELVRTLGDKFEAVSGQPSVIFPEISWDGTVIIPETVVPLMPDGFSFIQPIVRQVTTLVLCLAFLNMLKNQFSLFVGAYAEIDQLTSQQSDE